MEQSKISMLDNIQQSIQAFTNQQFYFTVRNEAYRCKFNLYIGPEESYLGVFNQLIKTESSFTFIYDKRILEKNYRKYLSTNFRKKNYFIKIAEFNENDTININSSNFENIFIRAFHVIKNVFSSSFIENHQISPTTLEIRLNQLKNTNTKEPDNNNSPVMRFEEIVNNKRIIISISPIDGDIRLSIASLVESGIYNPITSFFENLFNYEPYRYERFCSKHNLIMGEEQGYPEYPRAKNNIQNFSIKFNYITEGELEVVIKRSSRSLQQFISKIIFLLDLLAGSDLYARGVLDKKSDMMKESDESKYPFMTYLCYGSRIYGHPEYDISISFYPVVETDDNDKEFLVSKLDIRVDPFENQERPIIGTFLHPIGYDMGK
jgi:hypothetical protein